MEYKSIDRNELINRTAESLKRNGHDSVITLNCVSQLLKLSICTTFEADLAMIVENMAKAKERYCGMSASELLETVHPVFLEDEGFKSCGFHTKLMCFKMYHSSVQDKSISGNIKIDAQKAVGNACMYVEYALKRDFASY